MSISATPDNMSGKNGLAFRIVSAVYGSFIEIKKRFDLGLLSLLYIASIAIAFLTLVAPDKSYTRTWPNDVMSWIDIANRVYQGQAPYFDFHLFHGPLVAIVPALGLTFGFKGGVTLGFDAVVVAAVLLLLAAVTVARRLTLPSAILVFTFALLLIVVPLGEGYHFEEITWGTFYNRQCWAALIIILLFYLEPERVGRSDKFIDAIALSVLVLFEFYTKITFGVVAIAFVFANSVVSKYNRHVSILTIVLVGLSVVSLELAFHFHSAYLRNITELTSKIPPLGLHGFLTMLLDNLPVILACCAALVMIRASGRSSKIDGLFVIGCIAANMLVRMSIGDNPTGRLVALVAVLLCLGELARRSEIRRPASTTKQVNWRQHLPSLMCLFLAFAFMSTEIGTRVLAWASYSVRVIRGSTTTAALAGAPPNLAGFLVYKDEGGSLFDLPVDGATRSDRRKLTTEEYLKTVIEGTKLLQSVDYAKRSVVTFDEVDAFTYAMDMRPGGNGYPQPWPPIVPRQELLPPSEALFRDIDFVMIPRLPYDVTQFKSMTTLYGAYLKQNYVRLKESAHWELWKRR